MSEIKISGVTNKFKSGEIYNLRVFDELVRQLEKAEDFESASKIAEKIFYQTDNPVKIKKAVDSLGWMVRQNLKTTSESKGQMLLATISLLDSLYNKISSIQKSGLKISKNDQKILSDAKTGIIVVLKELAGSPISKDGKPRQKEGHANLSVRKEAYNLLVNLNQSGYKEGGSID